MTHPIRDDDFSARLTALEAENAELKAEMARLGGRSSDGPSVQPEEEVSRRHLLQRIGGAVAAGAGLAVAGSMLRPDEASAAVGAVGEGDATTPGVWGYNNEAWYGVRGDGSTSYGVYGRSNSSNAIVGDVTNSFNGVYGHNAGTGNGVFGESTSGNGNGVIGISQGASNSIFGFKPPGIAGDAVVGWARSGKGAWGISDSGNGVQADSTSGIGVFAVGGKAPLLLVPAGTTGAPASGTHSRGEFVVDSQGSLFHCKAGDGTGVGTWLRVGFNPINPTRIVDTRPLNAPTSHGDAPLAEGEEFTVQITGVAGVPTGASAVVLNVTAVSPSVVGYLSLYPADQGPYTHGSPPPFSNVNMVAGGAPTPNLATVKLGPDGAIKVFNFAGTTHVILDVAGFYS